MGPPHRSASQPSPLTPRPGPLPSGRTPNETLNPGAGVMESLTFEDVAVGLIQEWALLDGARRNLCQFVILDKCRILAPRDWESQLKSKASTPVQAILEENSSHEMQMVENVLQ
ncbi:zinc finger protein 333-like isoform X2 [Ailuropoda melanoleuca]|uniref:zinc finger protein 333-like isoform X2 n=1 Tax=Ailuropoda melanoleuca TaxID=9646 RepID=UPI001494D8D6|nr:zinc finger protein 333-like isoform X2 [Ailuropoda melanoleuca]